MENTRKNTAAKPQLFGLLAGLFLAAGLVFATSIAARAFLKVSEGQSITVTGSAKKDIRSDLAVWDIHFHSEGKTIGEAAENSKTALVHVEAFLKNANHCEYSILPLQSGEIFEKISLPDGTWKQTRTGFRVVQTLQVRSTDTALIPRLASQTGQLLEHGILLQTVEMKFIYTKAGEAKIEMMGEATKDARIRAEQIAALGGRKVKELRTARAGVIQITPRYSTETRWDGMNDTTTADKTITTTVSATFSLE